MRSALRLGKGEYCGGRL